MTRQSVYAPLLLVLLALLLLNGCWPDHKKGQETQEPAAAAQPLFQLDTPTQSVEVDSDEYTLEGEIQSRWALDSLSMSYEGKSVPLSTSKPKSKSKSSNLVQAASSTLYTYYFSLTVKLAQPGVNQFVFIIKTPEGESQHQVEIKRKDHSNTPLQLTLAANQESVTYGETLLLAGQVGDEKGRTEGITLTVSNSLTGQSQVVTADSQGHFSQGIALPLGRSTLTLLVQKSGYQSVSQTLAVQRRSLPQLTITSPANGAEFTDEGVTVEGEVISLWPQERLKLTQGDTALTLESGSSGHYRFSQKVTLAAGENSFTFLLQTPDGDAQQVVQLKRKVTPKPDLKLTLTLASDQATQTDGESLLVSGVVQDQTSSGTDITLSVLSDKSSERVSVSVAADGHFSQAVPLPLGASQLTLLAEKSGYQSASQTLSVQRRSLPQLAITTPANGSELESESVTVEGEVTSLWPQEQLVLTHAGQSVALQLTSTGLYHFSQRVALVEGDNSIPFLLQTPDGDAQQVLQLKRKVTPKPDLKLTLTLAADQATQTDGESLLMSGVVQDAAAQDQTNSGTDITLSVLSDKSSERVSVNVAADGHFSQAIPLPLGASKLTLLAERSGYQSASQTLGVQRRSLPQLSITTPANGSELESENVTVEGEVTSLWPQEQLVLTQAGQAVVLQPTSIGHYHFSQRVALVEGENRFTFLLQTPDGDAQQVLQLKRKVTPQPDLKLTLTLASDQATQTDGESLLVSGVVQDQAQNPTNSGTDITLSVLSDKSSERVSVSMAADGHFRQAIPLPLGASQLTLLAEKVGYQSASQTLAVQRRSLPQLTISLPANGSEIESENVTVEGEVISLWPQEQLVLTHAGQSVALQAAISGTGTSGHYYFSQSVALLEGENSFTFVLQTPDGDAQKVLQLKRKVTPKPDLKLTLTLASDQATQTDGESLLVSGVVLDQAQTQINSGTDITLSVLSDKSSERVSVSVAADGHFSQAIPLPLGASKLTLLAEKAGYQSASQTLSVQRRSVPQLTISSPANGSELESESVAIEGEVISLWPQEQLVLTQAGQAVVLQPTLTGHYHFSQSVALVEGENSFTFLLQTPDGDAQQVVQLKRKVTPKPDLKLTLTLASDQATQTDGESLLVSGVVQDAAAQDQTNSGTDITLSVLNDKIAERVTVSVAADGHFSQAIPLPLGASKLTLLAEKSGYQSASQTLSVQRRSLPQLSITSPTNGSELSGEIVTVTGRVLSAWPKSELALHQGSESLTLELVSPGSYQFQQQVVLTEGSNTLTYLLQSSDGDSQQILVLTRKVTPQPLPKLTLTLAADQAAQTDGDTLLVKGMAQDEQQQGAGIQLKVLNDKQGVVATLPLEGEGHFSQAIPLPLGASTLTLLAEKSGSQSASQTLTVQRRSLPQLAITSPANGAELASEGVTVEGEVTSLWPQEQLVLTQAGQAVALQLTSIGHYHFSQRVALVEGDNRFTFLLQTPDGDAQQVLQLKRKVTPKPDLKLTLTLASDQATQTDGESLLVSGMVQDQAQTQINSGTDVTLSVLSDKSSERVTVSVAADGHFSQAIPLPLGASNLTLLAEKSGYQSASQTLSVQRRSLPQLTISSPADGAALESERVTVEGEVISLWPQAQLMLTQAGQSVALAPTQAPTEKGHYRFSHTVALAEGSNSLLFILATPDGERRAELKLTRQSADRQGPTLQITTANDLHVAASEQVIVGSVSDASGIKQLLLRSSAYPGTDFVAALKGESFQATVPLKPGQNQITVLAEDNQGNRTQQQITLFRGTPPEFVAISPATNSVVSSATTTVAGEIRSQQGDPILRLFINDRAASLTPLEGGRYHFELAEYPLTIGSNTLRLLAETALAQADSEVTLSYQPQNSDAIAAPTLTLLTPANNSLVTADAVTVKGQVESHAGPVVLTLEGKRITISSQNSYANGDIWMGYFTTQLAFAEGKNVLDGLLKAEDGLGKSAKLALHFTRDGVAPVLSVAALQPAPAINRVSEQSLLVSGEVSDDNLANLTLNDQALTLEPQAQTGHYRFSTQVAVPAGNSLPLLLVARDLGGNQSAKEYRVQSLTTVSLQPLLPADESELLSQGSAMTLQVAAQLGALPSDAKVEVRLDDAPAITLASDQQVASGEVSVAPEAAAHTLIYQVVQGGKVLATALRHFKVVDDKSIPLALLSVTPQSGSTGVEPDEPLVLYFNKTIETSLLQVELRETLHGKSYVNKDEAGASFLQAKGYQLQEVHRDQERVELNPSLLPDGKSISFYAKRMLGFGAQALVTISYQGQELSRFTYQVRPLPTFITGNVVDQFNQPLSGVVVELGELARKTVTNADGAFSFGFQEAAGQEIPAGRYRLTINGGLATPGFGMQQQQISVTAGVNNQLGMIPLLQLNPELAFQQVASGQAKVSFSDGELGLDFSAAHLQFPDSRDQGRLYFQFLPFEQLGANTMAGFTPLWAYAAQPKGVMVEGQVGISLTMPAYNGRYDYIPTGTERVILVGYDQDRGVIAPVGIGRIDNHVVHSEGTLALTSLDYIGYVILPVEWQSKLAAVAAGQLSLPALQAEITSTIQSTQAIAQ